MTDLAIELTLDIAWWRAIGGMAEEVGFEPTVRFPARRFSRPVETPA